MGIDGSFTRVKRPGRESNHLLPTTFKVTNAWSYTTIITHAFMTSCLNRKGELYFLFLLLYLEEYKLETVNIRTNVRKL